MQSNIPANASQASNYSIPSNTTNSNKSEGSLSSRVVKKSSENEVESQKISDASKEALNPLSAQEGIKVNSSSESNLEIQANSQEQQAREIVRKIIQQEKQEYEKEMQTCDPEEAEYLRKSAGYWEKQERMYLAFEKRIGNNDRIPAWEVAGPLNYSMSLNAMKESIAQKFKIMASTGHLMQKKTLDEKHDANALYPPPNSDRVVTNLTRIWGAEFLKSSLESTVLTAPDHFLIIDESQAEVEIEVYYGENYPLLSVVKNGYILSKRIEGDKKADEYKFSNELRSLGYQDFADPGNILKDSNSVGWIVDTEIQAFDSPRLAYVESMFRKYLKTRFQHLSGENPISQTFKIPLAEIGLKQSSN